MHVFRLRAGHRRPRALAYKRIGKPRNRAAKIWTRRDMGELAQNVTAAVDIRAFSKGLDTDDVPHKPYSVKPIYISLKSDTARRLKPKGGRLSRSGKSVFYAGGYAHYKAASTRSVGRVTLELNGQMRREFRKLRWSKSAATIGLSGPAKVYGSFVNEARPWIGLSPSNRKFYRTKLQKMLRRNLSKG